MAEREDGEFNEVRDEGGGKRREEEGGGLTEDDDDEDLAVGQIHDGDVSQTDDTY